MKVSRLSSTVIIPQVYRYEVGKSPPAILPAHLLLKPFTAPICWRLSPTYNSFRPTGHALIHRLNILNGVPSMCRFLAFKVSGMILIDRYLESYIFGHCTTRNLMFSRLCWQKCLRRLENPQECNTILVHMFFKILRNEVPDISDVSDDKLSLHMKPPWLSTAVAQQLGFLRWVKIASWLFFFSERQGLFQD